MKDNNKTKEQETKEQEKIEFLSRLAACNKQRPQNPSTRTDSLYLRIVTNKEVTGVPFMCG